MTLPTRLYGDFKENEYVRIFDNSDFGYNRITVERPLRLNFAVTEDRLQKLKEATAFVNLATGKKRKDSKAAEKEIEEGRHFRQAIIDSLKTIEGKGIVKNREDFSELVGQMSRN